jgi:hypothetical protein
MLPAYELDLSAVAVLAPACMQPQRLYGWNHVLWAWMVSAVLFLELARTALFELASRWQQFGKGSLVSRTT